MPSRCLNKGTLLSAIIRSINERPPRGTITSMLSLIFSISPTAIRSVVGTSWMLVSGRPPAISPAARHSAITDEVSKLSEPQRRMQALPAFRHRPPASAVTLGLDHRSRR